MAGALATPKPDQGGSPANTCSAYSRNRIAEEWIHAGDTAAASGFPKEFLVIVRPLASADETALQEKPKIRLTHIREFR